MRARLVALLGAALATVSVASATPAFAATGNVLDGGSYGFNFPHGVAYDGAHLWITNEGGDSVTEVNASDGSWVRTLSGGNYGFNLPTDIVFDGSHLWIANSAGNTVTEVNSSDGSWVRTLSGGSYAFNYPSGIAFDGTHLWVTNYYGNSVTEVNASDGTRVRVVYGSSYKFSAPSGIAFDGSHVWITNSGGNSVTEVNVSDGSALRNLAGGNYGFNYPAGIAYDGTHVWVTNQYGNSVSQVNASDGSWVRTLSGGSYGFDGPLGVAVDGSHAWITNSFGNSVTEVNASDGSLANALSGSPYNFNYPFGIASNGPHVWVANLYGNSVTDISTADSTSTNLALSSAAINNGVDTLTATATVTDTTTPSTAVNAGSVQFQVDGANVGSAVPVSNVGVAKIEIPTGALTGSTPVGTPHSVTALFSEGIKFASSTSQPAAFSLLAYASDAQNIQTSISAGTLLISTPYTPTDPLVLPAMALNQDVSAYVTSARFTGITVSDTRPGVFPYTLSAIASTLTKSGVSSPKVNEVIDAQNVGLDLSDLTATNVTPNTFLGSQNSGYTPCSPPTATCQNFTGFNNVPAPHVSAGAAGSAGLGGSSPHTVLHALKGLGTTVTAGTLTITAPTNTLDGTYSGTITFSIIGS
ncbi:MAG: NHL repeat-containing protein [Actinomycetes bacterium]